MPVRMPAVGGAATLTTAVPDFLSLVAVIVAAPPAMAVTRPVALTEATVVLDVPHETWRPTSGEPAASSRVAVICSVLPMPNGATDGETVTVATRARGSEPPPPHER